MAIIDEMQSVTYALAQELGNEFTGMVTMAPYIQHREKVLADGSEISYDAVMVEGIVEDGPCKGRPFKFSYRGSHFEQLLVPALSDLGIHDIEKLIGGSFKWVLKEPQLPAGYTSNPRFVPTPANGNGNGNGNKKKGKKTRAKKATATAN